MNNKSFKKFFVLWTGQLISSIGTGISAFGLAIYVFEKTNLASSTTLITLLAFLPSLLLVAPAGVLADRYDRRLLMILGDGLSTIGLFYILFCLFDGDASLWQIGIGVFISSIFSSLLEPSFRATVTDLLGSEDYSKANGLMQLANASKYLIAPIIAGFLLKKYSVALLIGIDIATIIVTVGVTLYIRRGIETKARTDKSNLKEDFSEGMAALRVNNGVFMLVIISMALTFFVGIIQTLATPMMLEFTRKELAGIALTISASGMIFSSFLLSMFPLKKNFVRTLSISLFLLGIFMVGFAFRPSLYFVCIFGFLFFAALPFINTSLDFLVRSNIDNEFQGRVWGLISFISQMGYVLAFAISGPLSDFVFKPLISEQGILGDSIGLLIGVGRGSALMIILSGILLSLTSLSLLKVSSVRKLDESHLV